MGWGLERDLRPQEGGAQGDSCVPRMVGEGLTPRERKGSCRQLSVRSPVPLATQGLCWLNPLDHPLHHPMDSRGWTTLGS